MRVRQLIRLAAVLIFAGLVATGVLFLPDDIQFLSEARPVEATVISVDRKRQGVLSFDVARVQLRLRDSILHYPVEVNFFDRVYEDQQVWMLYNPRIAPSLRFDTPFGRYESLGVFLLIVLGIFAALVVRLLFGALFWRRRAE